ncbi:MAG: arginine--tRNA ligase [Opitutae bacterium]|nr:arginine--tRNA ligase [Opitutae bacterium]
MQISYNLTGALDRTLRETASRTDGFDEDFSPEIRPADLRFGDYQANGVLPFAKKHGQNPREMAERLMGALEEDESLDVDIAGPGFLNFRFTPAFRLAWLLKYSSVRDFRNAVQLGRKPFRVVVDFSSPNTAKQMHVGHIRSTIIGDVMARLLNFSGNEVTRDNHIGDWGTQFGILILAIKRSKVDLDDLGEDSIAKLEDFYREGNQLIDGNDSLREEARSELVKLQQGEKENLAIWEKVNAISLASFHQVYDRLGIDFDEILGESFYRDKVDAVYEGLTQNDICEESEGALVVFHKEHKRFAKQPFIIRKSDGASNYATTDLATVCYRTDELGAEEIVYVTDGRQQDHFSQLFLTTEKWFAAEGKTVPRLRHVWFGTILGEDNKAIKTREGQPVRLLDLLDEAVSRAKVIVRQKNPELDETEMEKRARIIGLGAVRYADLSQDRTLDYVFSWDKLLALQGNTAPYLQYAVARIRSIFRKLEIEPGSGEEYASAPVTESENVLARKLIYFPSVLEQTIGELKPHHLCGYLYELATDFSSFYNADKVMVDEPEVRARRSLLCSRTLLILETGLGLLGIDTLAKM